MADSNAGPPSGSTPRIEQLRARWEADRSSRIFLQLAEELRRQGQIEEALSVLEVGVGQHPQWGAAQVALGRCRIELHQYEPGCAVLEAVVRKDPTQMVAYRLLVDGYLGLGDAGSARERLELYRELNPQDDTLGELEERLESLESVDTGEAASEEAEVTPPPAIPPLPPPPPSPSRAAEPDPLSSGILPSGPAPTESRSSGAAMAPPSPPAPITTGSELFSLPSSPAGAPTVPDLTTLAPPRRLSRGGRGTVLAATESSEPGLTGPTLGKAVVAGTPMESGPIESPPRESPAPPPSAVLEDAGESAPSSRFAAEVPQVDAAKTPGEDLDSIEDTGEDSAWIGGDVQLQAPIVIDPGSAAGSAPGDAPTLETRNPLTHTEQDAFEPREARAEALPDSSTGSEKQAPPPSDESFAELEIPDSIDLEPPSPLVAPSPLIDTDEGEPLIRDAESFEPPPPLDRMAGTAPPDFPATAPPAATSTLGELYLDQGHAREAKGIFERVLDSDPSNARARQGLEAVTRGAGLRRGEAASSIEDAGRPNTAAPLDALTLLRGNPPAGDGVTEKKSAVLEAYLQRIRSDRDDGGSDVS